MNDKRLLVDFEGLRALGVRYSRETLRRKEKAIPQEWPQHFHVGRHAYWWHDEIVEHIEKESKGVTTEK